MIGEPGDVFCLIWMIERRSRRSSSQVTKADVTNSSWEKHDGLDAHGYRLRYLKMLTFKRESVEHQS